MNGIRESFQAHIPDAPTVKARFEEVTVNFKSRTRCVQALSGFSLDIMENEITCIVGQSGCGKTTALNLLAGFLAPNGGRCLIDGLEVIRPSHRCAVVFQQDSVFPWMRTCDNVSYGLRFNGTPPAERRPIVEKYLRLVGLVDFADAWPRELSVGMRKRVDLARAYAANPGLLLLDEPFGQLDVLTREEMQTLLLDIWASEKKTMVCVTHDPEEALFLGHRVAVMSPRPGSIVRTITVPFSMPRNASLKCSAEFQSLRQELISSLGGVVTSDIVPRRL